MFTLWIYCRFGVKTMTLLSLREITLISPWINYQFSNLTMKTLLFLWNNYEFTIFSHSLWIDNVSRKFTTNSSYFAIQFTINFLIVYEFTIYLAIWLWIDYLSHLFTVNLISFRKYTMNSTMNHLLSQTH